MNNNKPVLLQNSISAFLNSLKITRVKSPATIKTYTSHLKDFSKFIGGNKKLNTVFLKDIDSYRAILIDTGISDATVFYKMVCIRSFLKWCKKQGIECLDFDLIETGKLVRNFKNIPTQKDIEALLDLCDLRSKKGLLLRTIIETLASSGLRVSELVGLTVKQVDQVNLRCTIVGKGGRTRLVLFSPSAMELIKKFLSQRKKQSIFLFPYSTRSIERWIKDLGKRANIEITPHKLRHAYALYLLGKGVNLRIIQKLLGHASLSVTEFYLQVSNPEIEKAHKEAFNHSLTYTSKSL